MEKLSKEQEKVLKTALAQIGLEKPSEDFLSNVMDAIEMQEKVTTPLISKKGWLLITFVFALSLSLLVFYPEEGSVVFDMVFSYRAGFVEKLFQGLEISKTMMMGICLLGLFLFQLPFLIKMTDKERSL
ncbi:hypothetical protein [Flagellimonas meridianipacifica]|uniref:Uncharacterized protein n=1 Tax=Flagellimonas meridianipacifica TaxID=1080225 RepID=A0A2T0MD64_9FLAO|nr:hypothetical protein [Allomuricauda pacifica]PRX55440.1 hypothetical protein CLV81_3852 [Allomuricauda pacifica]